MSPRGPGYNLGGIRLLRRTLVIALIVGTILSLINQGHIVFAGDATTATWVRVGVNYLIPFIVANAGAIAGKNAENRK